MIYGTILSFHMIPVDTNARLYRRMNEAATNYSASCGRVSTLHGRGGSPLPGLAGTRQWLLCSIWGPGDIYISPEKSAEIKSVQPSLSQCPPPEPGYPHYRCKRGIWEPCVISSTRTVWTLQLAQFIYIN